MKTRLIPLLAMSVVLALFAPAQSAATPPDPQQPGMDFTESEPEEKLIAEMAALCEQLNGFFAKFPLYDDRGAPNLETLTSELRRLLHMPLDHESLAHYNTKDFRNMRSAALTYFQAAAVLLRMCDDPMASLARIRAWWFENGSKFARGSASKDFPLIGECTEAANRFLKEYSAVVASPTVRPEVYELVYRKLTEARPYSEHMQPGGLGLLNVKTYNHFKSIRETIVRAHRLAPKFQSVPPQYDHMKRQRETFLNVWASYPDQTKGSGPLMRMLHQSLEKFDKDFSDLFLKETSLISDLLRQIPSENDMLALDKKMDEAEYGIAVLLSRMRELVEVWKSSR